MKIFRRLLPKRYNPLHWRKAAYHDAHGLRNRTWLFDTAERLYAQKKSTWDFLLLYIDLCNFRSVNNQFSHTAGNEVLKRFYELLEKKFRTHRTEKSFRIEHSAPERDVLVVREGGDEYVVLLPLGVCDEEKRNAAEKQIRNRIKNLQINYKGVNVTARVVMVGSTPEKPFANFAEYFQRADEELTKLHRHEH